MTKPEANIYIIAKEAGVSTATVSRVINRSGRVSEQTAKRVLDAVSKYNYVPNCTARSLSTSTSTTVGVIVPDIGNPFFSQLIDGITKVADESGLQVFLSNTSEDPVREHQVLRSMREQRLCGLIITPVSEKDTETLELLNAFSHRGIPVILLDREIEGGSFDSVVTADEQGSYEAVSRLIQLGHRRIAIITGPPLSRPGRERFNGYCRAMREAGIPLEEQYMLPGDFRTEKAYRQTLELFRLVNPPTAVFSSNNMTTYGCLRALQQLGLAVGKQIAFTGFDDIEPLDWLNFRLSVVSRDVPQMGREAMSLLRKRLDSGGAESGKRVILPTRLILRGSEQIDVPAGIPAV